MKVPWEEGRLGVAGKPIGRRRADRISRKGVSLGAINIKQVALAARFYGGVSFGVGAFFEFVAAGEISGTKVLVVRGRSALAWRLDRRGKASAGFEGNLTQGEASSVVAQTGLERGVTTSPSVDHSRRVKSAPRPCERKGSVGRPTPADAEGLEWVVYVYLSLEVASASAGFVAAQ